MNCLPLNNKIISIFKTLFYKKHIKYKTVRIETNSAALDLMSAVER